VPVVACLTRFRRWLSSLLANADIEDTAVSVIVESMSLRSNLASRRSIEKMSSHIGEHLEAKGSEVVQVGEDGWLEEVDRGLGVLVIDFVLNSSIERSEVVVIELSENQLLDSVPDTHGGRGGLVKRIEA
jgi:hypothetical protein